MRVGPRVSVPTIAMVTTMNASTGIDVTRVEFTPAPRIDQLTGLLGHARVELNRAVVISGVAVRRARAGHFVLSFPVRGGRPVVAPLDAAMHSDLERQIIEMLRTAGRLAS